MALSSGDRLGDYEVIAVIGAGGMGRVYRARDTRLQRQVAIKVLSDDVAADPDRIARFGREARTLATLNHPHIAQIYGTEQSGISHALVMELVEGEDVSRRIAHGPIPWHEAAPIAQQIAEALEAAHDHGIVHRDLKPGNIKITPDGLVKVLDFGLAKAVESIKELSPASSTITSPAGMTLPGFLLGTAAYMSPEQAKGRPADKRSDVWAFGCVLYEMLTGKRAFPGDDVVETLAAIVRAEPDFSALPADLPVAVRCLIEQCLVKDRRARIGDIAAAKFALRLPAAVAPPIQPARARIGWVVVAALTVLAAAGVIAPWLASREIEPSPVVRSTIAAPGLGLQGPATVTISRRGTHIAYASQGRLAVRNLSEDVARLLPGTENASSPFFSHDGEWIGFFAEGKLKKIPLSGGAARVVADAPAGRGGSWAADGSIVFAPVAEGGLSQVSGDGGPVAALTKPQPNERSHRWPQVLPDGRHVIFTIQLAGKLFLDGVIAAIPIGGGEPRTIVEGGSGAQFVESGHLVYAADRNLLAIQFDPVTASASGGAITVVENVRTNDLNGVAPVAIAANGTLVYIPGPGTAAGMRLLVANRTGQVRTLLERRVFSNFFRISPDGKRVAASINDGRVDLWLIDIDGRGQRRFTFDDGSQSYPVWSPDGGRLYYLSNSGGTPRAVVKALDSSGVEEDLSANTVVPTTISPDGLILAGGAIPSTLDVVALNVRTRATVTIAATRASESEPAFSHDGRYVAFQSDESGRLEVYVQEYPSGSRWQLSTSGGSEPRWASGGRELVYRSGATLYAVPVTLQPFSQGSPIILFSIPNLMAFDVTADGQRFVLGQASESAEAASFVVITSWFEELKAKMRAVR